MTRNDSIPRTGRRGSRSVRADADHPAIMVNFMDDLRQIRWRWSKRLWSAHIEVERISDGLRKIIIASFNRRPLSHPDGKRPEKASGGPDSDENIAIDPFLIDRRELRGFNSGECLNEKISQYKCGSLRVMNLRSFEF